MTMQILDLEQGSEAWLEARLNYFCASEAAAMLGKSKFMTRSELLDLKSGWKTLPISDFKKSIFEKGHEKEDLARQVWEERNCEELNPAVGLRVVDGLQFLASFDGYIKNKYIWEHKSYNPVLAENIKNGVIEDHYWLQLEHQMIVAGLNKVDFYVSDGTQNKLESMTYFSVPERKKIVLDGWKIFSEDLKKHKIKPKKEVVVANKTYALPELKCLVHEKKIESNFEEYLPILKQLSEQEMAQALETDLDFKNKEDFNKAVKKARLALKAKTKEVTDKFDSFSRFLENVRIADGILQKLYSKGEKQVKDRKNLIKSEIINAAWEEIRNYKHAYFFVAGENILINFSHDFDACIKGKRSLNSIQNAVDAEVLKIKIELDRLHALASKNLGFLNSYSKEYNFLFKDIKQIIFKENEDFQDCVKIRYWEYNESLKNKKVLDKTEEIDQKPEPSKVNVYQYKTVHQVFLEIAKSDLLNEELIHLVSIILSKKNLFPEEKQKVIDRIIVNTEPVILDLFGKNVNFNIGVKMIKPRIRVTSDLSNLMGLQNKYYEELKQLRGCILKAKNSLQIAVSGQSLDSSRVFEAHGILASALSNSD